jgi:hypothetical protein
MDWKFKHFRQERSFQSPRDEVLDAARAYLNESLGWTIKDTPNGFTAEGFSFFHAAIADFQIKSRAEETSVAVELRVERAGGAGFMLFDAGGYYSIQIRKWLDGIQWRIHNNLTGGDLPAANPHVPSASKTTARLFNGLLGFIAAIFVLWALVTVISAAVGLITGNLYLWGRGGTHVIHGVLARIVSASILLAGVWIGWKIKRGSTTGRSSAA